VDAGTLGAITKKTKKQNNIYDISGKLINQRKNQRIDNRESIYLKYLPTGTYYIQIFNQEIDVTIQMNKN
jgi:hypothetical protein